MLNVQTIVALSRRIRNTTAYSRCMLGTVSDRVTPGKHPGAGSAKLQLQLRRPMMSVDSRSGQPAHAQQPRQQQQAAGSGDGPYTA